jgi:hypothetical protein
MSHPAVGDPKAGGKLSILITTHVGVNRGSHALAGQLGSRRRLHKKEELCMGKADLNKLEVICSVTRAQL